MKYLRKFNEGLTIDEVRELTYDIEDILIEVDDLNIKEDVDYDYEIKKISNGLTGKTNIFIIISKKNIALSSCRKFDGYNFFELSKIKPIFDRIVRIYIGEPFISVIYTSDSGQYQSIKGEYDKMLNKPQWVGGNIDTHYLIDGYEISNLKLILEV